MNIFRFLILVLYFSTALAQAKPESTISLNFEKVTLANLFEAVEKQSNYKFAYKTQLKHLSVRRLHLHKGSIKELLQILKQKTSLAFSLIGNNVAVYKAENKILAQQSGSLRGKVFDAANPKDFLPGATILIKKLGIGTATDIYGNFNLKNLPEGKHELQVSYLGYNSRRVSAEVLRGNALELNIGLQINSSKLNEVVVSAPLNIRYAPLGNSTEESMVSAIKTSPVVLTGISNEQIARSLDISAGEVVRRVPGVSMIDDFVVLRGMDPRYNLTMINGMITPSTEMDTRAFKYNLLPSSVIDQMMVQKSPSPELPGNFGGGIVKIETKKTAVARRLEINYLQQFRTMGSSFADFYTYEGSSKDWYGGGVADRQLPPILLDPTYEVPDKAFYTEEVVKIGKQLPKMRVPKKESHNFDGRAYINYNDSWKLGKWRLNNLSYANYEFQRQFTQTNLQYDAGKYHDNGKPIGHNGLFTDSLYTETVRLSAMQNLSLIINDRHNLHLTSFGSRRAYDKFYNREETEGIGLDSRTKVLSYSYRVSDIVQAQLNGSHRLGSHHIGWSAGLNRAYENLPDLQRLAYITKEPIGDENILWGIQERDYRARLSTKTNERAGIYQLNYAKNLGQKLKLLSGLRLEERHRQFYSNMIRPAAASDDVFYDSAKPWNGIDTVYSKITDPSSSTTIRSMNRDRFFPDRYSFDDNIKAGYLAATAELFKNRLKIHAGIRYEHNKRLLFDEEGKTLDSVVVGRDSSTNIYEKTPKKIQAFLLPSVNLSYNFNEKTALRAAWGRSIDRPQFREQSSFEYFDFEAGYQVVSNPLLVNAEIDNYDLRLEYFPAPGEFIALGAFVKKITNAIEIYDVSQSGWSLPYMKPLNTDRADIQGVELEARKNLGFIKPWLNQLSVICNAALIKSKITLFFNDLNGNEFKATRTMQGTSPYLINLGLYYGQDTSPTKVSLIYFTRGDRLRIVEQASNQDLGALYEHRRQLLGLTFSQKLGKALQIKGGAQNLLNSPYQFYRDGNRNGKFDPGFENTIAYGSADSDRGKGDYMERSHQTGVYLSLGMVINL
ncbi:MAG: TonB-dependent receptor domain-containing protein [Tenacibaculum sp.]